MANFDGTGPNGQGAMTGKGMGHCNLGGRGRIGGRGFGRRMGFARQEITQSKENLQTYKKTLEAELASVKEALNN